MTTTDSKWVDSVLRKAKHEDEVNTTVEDFVKDVYPQIPNLPDWLSSSNVVKMIAKKLYAQKHNKFILHVEDQSTFLADDFRQALAQETSKYQIDDNKDLLVSVID